MYSQNQCPYQGGISVYRARVFVSVLNEEVEYDDDSICELQGIYRQSIQQSSIKNESGITIHPNPTSDFAEIILTNQYEGICNIEIKDITGRAVYSGSFDCKEKSKIVSVTTFTAGIYTVTVTIDNKFVKSAKLSILR